MFSTSVFSACDSDPFPVSDDFIIPLDPSNSMALPDGAVVAFDSFSCPTGWSNYSLLNGRVIVGKGIGNNDADGNPLTARSLGSTGGLEYTTGIPAYSGAGNAGAVDFDKVIAAAATDFLTTSPGIDTMGTETDSNLPPFLVRHYCKKDDSTATLAATAVLSFDSASCSTGFTADTASAGRVILGDGIGNNDSHGASLSIRTFGDTGGYEETVMGGFPVNDTIADDNIPGPDRYFADSTVPTYDTSFDSIFGGTNVDSNLPPFVVLTSCESASEMTSVQSGAVVAFDLIACPEGWSTYSEAAGRVVVSSGSGAGLTARAFGATGGHEFTTGVPGFSDTGGSTTPVAGYLASAVGMYSSNAPDTTIGGVKEDSNMPPYAVLLYCKKN